MSIDGNLDLPPCICRPVNGWKDRCVDAVLVIGGAAFGFCVAMMWVNYPR